MKIRYYLHLFFALLFMFVIHWGVAFANVLTFDDIDIWNPDYYAQYPHDGECAPIPDGYGGFDWQNFFWNDATQDIDNGFERGVVSGYYEAFNAWGKPASLNNTILFEFNGAYLTAVFSEGLSVNISGYLDNELKHEQTIIVNTLGPSWLDFSYAGLLDRLDFESSGGSEPHTQFVMDNFTFNSVPEPTTVLLLGSGLIGLAGFRRKFKKS